MHETEGQSTYQVVLLLQRGLRKGTAEGIARLFDENTGPVRVLVHPVPIDLATDVSGRLKWEDLFRSIARTRAEGGIPESAFVHLLTSAPNENDWYAAEDPRQMRSSFGHVGDFRWVTSAPGYAVATHYLWKAIFNCLLAERGIAWKRLWHMDPRGCFFDFCKMKQELSLKLRTADICGDCMEVLQSAGIPDPLLQQAIQILEATRKFAVNTARFLPHEEWSGDWPFPVAATRHKVVQATNPLHRFLLLLDHFDSILRYFYIANEVVHGRSPAIVERPSQRWWVERLAGTMQGEHDFRTVVLLAQKESSLFLRNGERGHGWMSADTEAFRSDAARMEEVMSRIEDELDPFLSRYELVVPRRFERRNGKTVVEGEALRGSHPSHPHFALALEHGPGDHGFLGEGQVYIRDKDSSFFQVISPYIRSGLCPRCRHPRILVTDGGNQYIDVFAGHRVELS